VKVSTPHALGANNYVEDRETGELKRPHHINLKTGMSRGRQVIAPKEDEGSTKRRNLRAIEPPLRPLTPLRRQLPRGGAIRRSNSSTFRGRWTAKRDGGGVLCRRPYCVRPRAWMPARRASTDSGVTCRLWAVERACSSSRPWRRVVS
jgi:ribosomal protein L32